MTQFTLNIPSEKLQAFLNMMVQTGFTKSLDLPRVDNTRVNKLNPILAKVNANVSQHPYYDWDFYSNDILID